MADTQTSRRLTGLARRVLGAGAAVALAATATLALAVPAGAHTPKTDAYCKDEGTTLKVQLTNYNTTHENSVYIEADGEVLVDEADFGNSYEFKREDFDPTVAHTFLVEVLAWDDEDGEKGWSFSEVLEVEACVEAPTTTATTSEVAPTTSDEVAPTTSEEAAPTSPPAGGDSGDLADTGASIAIPIVLGALMLVGGAALLLLVRRRGNSNA